MQSTVRVKKYPPGVGHAGRKLAKPFTAHITIDGKRRFIGYFVTPEDAHTAYLAEVARRPPIEKTTKRPRRSVSPPDLAKLREFLHYDRGTGIFTWLVSKRSAAGSGVVSAGERAGTMAPNGYIFIGIDGFRYAAHRLAWLYVNGAWPESEIDHEDRNPTNNAISNLRPATRKQNNANTGVSKNNRCGRKGVCFEKRRRKWRATINVDGKQRHLGLFSDIDDAAAAYRRAEIEAHGAFAHSCSNLAHIDGQHIHLPDPPR